MILEGTNIDRAVHILTAVISLILFTWALVSYYKHPRPKFFYICFAFFLAFVKETLTTIDIFQYSGTYFVGVIHLLNMVVLVLFFIGVIK